MNEEENHLNSSIYHEGLFKVYSSHNLKFLLQLHEAIIHDGHFIIRRNPAEVVLAVRHETQWVTSYTLD